MDPYAHPPTPGEVGVLLSGLGFANARAMLHVEQGDVNVTFLARDAVVRIARSRGRERDWTTEGLAHPYAYALGLPTPELLWHGRDALGRAMVRRVSARSLAHLGDGAVILWASFGAILARLHASPGPDDPDGVLHRQGPKPLDPQALPRSLGDLARELAPFADASGEAFVHGDVAPDNLLREDGGELWLLDWGHAGRGHPALDFWTVPPIALRSAWEGYARAGGTVDDELRRRTVALHLSYAFHPANTSLAHRLWLGANASLLRGLAFDVG